MIFDSREQAGELLAQKLHERGVVADAVFGLARGGVVVATQVARSFNVPLFPLIVRKIGAPGNAEFALGAIAEIPGTDRTLVQWDKKALKMVPVADEWKKQRVEEKKMEVLKYRDELQFSSYLNRSNHFNHFLLVDDGAATGTSMLAAIFSIKQAFSQPIITVALPVSSIDAAEELGTIADDMVILHEDSELSSVGQFYKDFPQVEWKEVRDLLESSKHQIPKSK